jgi:CDP-diglyceride synthetase
MSTWQRRLGRPSPDVSPTKGFAGGAVGYWLFLAVIFVIVMPCGAVLTLIEKLIRRSPRTPFPVFPVPPGTPMFSGEDVRRVEETP